jgi:hypothetical protein
MKNILKTNGTFFLCKVVLFQTIKIKKSWQTKQKARARVKDKVEATLVRVVETTVVKAERNKLLPAAVLLLKTWSLEKKVNHHLAVIMETQEEAIHANSRF